MNALNVGVRIGGRIANNLRYAYDTTLCSETETDKGLLIKRVRRTVKMLNSEYTKDNSNNDNWHLNLQNENWNNRCGGFLVFVESIIHMDGQNDNDITRRMLMDKIQWKDSIKYWKIKVLAY